jgi:hypothetical protein
MPHEKHGLDQGEFVLLVICIIQCLCNLLAKSIETEIIGSSSFKVPWLAERLCA